MFSNFFFSLIKVSMQTHLEWCFAIQNSTIIM